MRKFITSIFLFFTIVIFNEPIFAQSPLIENISMKSIIETGTNPVLMNGSYSFDVNDTLNISSFELLVGSYKDSNDLVNNNFLFDVTAGLTANLSYSRVGNKVTLSVSDIPQKDTYYGKVIVHLSNNTQSDAFRFVGN